MENDDGKNGALKMVDQLFSQLTATWQDEDYCAYGTKEPEKRECYCCSMVNYGLDCHNNPIRNNDEE